MIHNFISLTPFHNFPYLKPNLFENDASSCCPQTAQHCSQKYKLTYCWFAQIHSYRHPFRAVLLPICRAVNTNQEFHLQQLFKASRRSDSWEWTIKFRMQFMITTTTAATTAATTTTATTTAATTVTATAVIAATATATAIKFTFLCPVRYNFFPLQSCPPPPIRDVLQKFQYTAYKIYPISRVFWNNAWGTSSFQPSVSVWKLRSGSTHVEGICKIPMTFPRKCKVAWTCIMKTNSAYVSKGLR